MVKRRVLSTVLLALLALACRAIADYPIVAYRHLADPSTMVHDGRVYVYCSNDDDNPVEGGYSMKSIVCVSSRDLKNWTDHGEVMRVPTSAAWAVHTWAPAAIARNGRFYLYFSNNASSIGVASSSSPTGPFVDARGTPLINSATPGVLPATNMWIFDPAAFIDDDGQAYLYFGGNGESNVRIIRLNEDMISTSGAALALTVPAFFEAAWMHKHNGVYYFSYSTQPSAGMRIDYLTSSSPTSGFTYRGILAGQPPINNNNNHAATFELNGSWYHVFHNRVVATQAGIPTTYRRNLGIERFAHNADGTLQQVTYTTDGVPQAGHLDPYTRVEAETMSAQSGIETESCSEGGMNVTQIDSGDWVRIRGVDFGSLGAISFSARVASATSGGAIELRLGGPAGTLVGTCVVGATGGGQVWTSVTCNVSGASGVQDLYLVFTGSGSSLFNIDWWRFTAAQPPDISGQPRPLTLAPGSRLSLWVQATGHAPLDFQWMKDGVPIVGATGQFYEVEAASVDDAGVYSVEVVNSAGSEVSTTAAVVIDASVSARLVNMSVRAPLASGAVLIPGFVRSGSSPRQLLLRAVGPTLEEFEVVNVLADPRMALHAGDAVPLTNDNWGDAANVGAITTAAQELGAFPLGAGSRDAAGLADLAPAAYTVHVTGVAGSSGVVLFELYEGEGIGSRFVNISARGDIGAGENIMIPGFVIEGTGATTLLLRAVGPSLAGHNVVGWLEDPVLTLYQGGTAILANDDWAGTTQSDMLRTVAAAVGAFPLDAGSADSALLVTLMPGTYTALARGKDEGRGNVLVEVYEVL